MILMRYTTLLAAVALVTSACGLELDRSPAALPPVAPKETEPASPVIVPTMSAPAVKSAMASWPSSGTVRCQLDVNDVVSLSYTVQIQDANTRHGVLAGEDYVVQRSFESWRTYGMARDWADPSQIVPVVTSPVQTATGFASATSYRAADLSFARATVWAWTGSDVIVGWGAGIDIESMTLTANNAGGSNFEGKPIGSWESQDCSYAQ